MSKDRVIVDYLKSVLNTLVYDTSINYNNNVDIEFIHVFIKNVLNFINEIEKKVV